MIFWQFFANQSPGNCEGPETNGQSSSNKKWFVMMMLVMVFGSTFSPPFDTFFLSHDITFTTSVSPLFLSLSPSLTLTPPHSLILSRHHHHILTQAELKQTHTNTRTRSLWHARTFPLYLGRIKHSHSLSNHRSPILPFIIILPLFVGKAQKPTMDTWCRRRRRWRRRRQVLRQRVLHRPLQQRQLRQPRGGVVLIRASGTQLVVQSTKQCQCLSA